MTSRNPDAEKNTRRVFFALWPDAATRQVIERFTRAAIDECGGEPVRPENFHITLRFIGNVDAAALGRLRKAAARVRTEALQFRLDKLGFWPEPAVFWLGCRKTPDPLLRLVVNLNTELGSEGFGVETRPFRPHLTLARDARQAPEADLPERVEWSSESFALVLSETGPEGVHYTVLEEWALETAEA